MKNYFLKKLNSLPKFDKESRSTFRYWFYHWYAYQLTALHLKCWKFKYIFHDIEKPWLRLLFNGDYKRVQQWHRKHNSHHTEYMLLNDKFDAEAMIIDWECSHFTKRAGQMNAYETLHEVCKKMYRNYEETSKLIDAREVEEYILIFKFKMLDIMVKLGLIEPYE